MQFSAEIGVWTLGYEWTERAEGLCLEPRGPIRRGRFRTYDPFVELPLLFVKLAETVPDGAAAPDEVLRSQAVEFANRLGLLWGQSQGYVAGLNEFTAWQREVRILRRALQLWQKPEPDGQAELATILAERSPIVVSLAVEQKPDGSLATTLCLPSLIAVVWMQFAELVNGHLDVRGCTYCHRLYEVLPGFRPNRMYCSDACKSAAYRGRLLGPLDARGLQDETDVKPRREGRTKGE